MFVRSHLVISIAVAKLISGLSAPVLAQTGTLTGVVRDASGAVVPGSAIVIHQEGSAFERIAETGRDGRFTVAPVSDGEYTIDVIAPGFGVLNATTSPTTRIPTSARSRRTGAPLPIYRPDAGRTVRGGIRWSWAR